MSCCEILLVPALRPFSAWGCLTPSTIACRLPMRLVAYFRTCHPNFYVLGIMVPLVTVYVNFIISLRSVDHIALITNVWNRS